MQLVVRSLVAAEVRAVELPGTDADQCDLAVCAALLTSQALQLLPPGVTIHDIAAPAVRNPVALLRAAGQLLRGRPIQDLKGSTYAVPEPSRLLAVVSTVLALTWLNPHVYLGTFALLGPVGSSHGSARWTFAGGAMCGSMLWFSALGLAARSGPRRRPSHRMTGARWDHRPGHDLRRDGSPPRQLNQADRETSKSHYLSI